MHVEPLFGRKENVRGKPIPIHVLNMCSDIPGCIIINYVDCPKFKECFVLFQFLYCLYFALIL